MMMMSLILTFLIKPVAVSPVNGDAIYPTCGVVCEVNGNDVTFRDLAGRQYTIPTEDGDWNVNDVVSCIMWDNNTTETVMDDIVLSYRYCGYVK